MKNVIETTCKVLSESTDIITTVQPKENSMKESIMNFFSETFTEENITSAVENTVVALAVSTQAIVDSAEYVADKSTECASTVAEATTSVYEQGKEYVSNINVDEFKDKMDAFTTESK